MNNDIFLDTFKEHVKCPICYSISEDCLESSCCGNIFCRLCAARLGSAECPLCRAKEYAFNPNLMARKLVLKMPTECKWGCGLSKTLEDVKRHQRICKLRTVKCNVFNCGFKCSVKEYPQHLIKSHLETLSIIGENFEEIVEKDKLKRIMAKIPKERQDKIEMKISSSTNNIYDEMIDFEEDADNDFHN